MRISGRLIDAFLALAETQKFSAAAERCYVSPSAFSQMISRLEAQLGVKLFDRNTRNVALTPAGQIFLIGAKRVTVELQASLEAIRSSTALTEGHITVAAPPSLMSDWLPQQLQAFRAQYAAIALRVHDVVSDRCLAMIACGEVDFGLNAMPGNDVEFESHYLFSEPFHLLCRHDDPLAQHTHVWLKALNNRLVVQTTRFGSVYHYTQALLAAAGARDSGIEVAQFGSLAGLIAAGFGISIVPASTLPLCLRHELTAIQIRDHHALRPFYRVKRRHRSLSAAAQALWERIGDTNTFPTFSKRLHQRSKRIMQA